MQFGKNYTVYLAATDYYDDDSGNITISIEGASNGEEISEYDEPLRFLEKEFTFSVSSTTLSVNFFKNSKF